MRRDLLDDRGLDALRGLVEQDQRRAADQHAADGKLLLLAARHGAGALLPRRSAQDREEGVDAVVVGGLCAAIGSTRRPSGSPPPSCGGRRRGPAAHSRCRDGRADVRQAADVAGPRSVTAPSGRGQQADQGLHQRRFADAVAPDHRRRSRPARTVSSTPAGPACRHSRSAGPTWSAGSRWSASVVMIDVSQDRSRRRRRWR